jgi:CheY-like chemotaxis protein
MHQVFLNLCVNARDAMPSGGTLEVTMENVVLDDTYAAMNLEATPGPYIMVSVSDTGIGIPPEVRERIFEPFFTTKEVGQGTGLGLSTTLAIMKSHRGFINVYSEVGKGTKFKLYFPADATETAAESVAVERTGLPRGRGELVLVVDDEEALRQIVKGTLERFGYRVMLAKNGAEAVALYAQHRSEIAVVLTDMAMPVLDGPATIVALQLISPSVKIIGTSGLPANGHVAKAVGSGVQHFVPKPYTAETMLRALEQILTNQTVP